MKKVFLLLAVCLLASVSTAGVVWTHQCWTFSTDDGPTGMLPDDPSGNPFGNGAVATLDSPFTLNHQDGYWSANAFNIVIDIPNNPFANAYKIVEVEMIFKGNINLSWIRDDQDNQFTRISHSITPIEGTDWLRVRDEWYIAPNPNWERLCYGFAGEQGTAAALSEVCIATQCVPEPATLAILGLGATALLRKRK